MDNNLTPKPLGITNRSSTWSAFGPQAPTSEPESEWPKSTTTTSGISMAPGNPIAQPSNAFDLVPEFEPGKSWHGTMLMKGLDDKSPISSRSATGAISAFAGAYANPSSKSPTESQYEPSGIGTWSPVVKGTRPGSKWDGDGPDNGRGDNGRFDDGTAIWGNPTGPKVAGVDWIEKTGDETNSNSEDMQKPVITGSCGNAGGPPAVASAAAYVASIQQPNNEFARAPGPVSSSIVDNNLTPKPFGLAARSSTWSAFGPQATNEPEPEWPKSTNTATSGISMAPGNPSAQPSNAFDLVPDFEAGKSWHGSMLIKGLEDKSPINSASNAGASAALASASYANPLNKSPPGSQYERSGIGTWSPIVKSNNPGSRWDGDGPDNEGGENGRFDDGTAIWGDPAKNKVSGVDWAEKAGETNSSDEKRSSASNNHNSYHPHQSSSSTSLLISSNTSPSNQQQHNRGNQQQNLNKQTSISHNFDQVQQQSNALSSQANQPNRGPGLSSSSSSVAAAAAAAAAASSSSNVPSKQQLQHLVQQIQVAVQNGHLNPQILYQPLAPVTLQLLYTLLQQIRTLQQLQMQVSQPFNKAAGNHPAAVNVHITKTKQNIINLQNQIAAQQAVFLKQPNNISSRHPGMPGLGTGSGIGPALPPGISQSGDSFRSGASLSDFHGSTSAMVNNFGLEGLNINGLANSSGQVVRVPQSRFDQTWRAPAAAITTNKHQANSMAAPSFTNHSLIGGASQGAAQKSLLNNGGNVNSFGGSNSSGGLQTSHEFTRAPGPASSMMDNNLTSKPFSLANRASTWSAFGAQSPNEPESEWPKSTTTNTTTSSGISTAPGNSTQPSNAFDLVPEFEPGKPWRGSMLMKSVEDDPTMTPGSMARSLGPQRKTIWSDEIL